mmetsp:Transcript_47912/g.154576  ORF Transcript_47912/g.154576 Transcript_47912/m.154576 type:complete len:428 (-) Transcript_47912:800-2083(-)
MYSSTSLHQAARSPHHAPRCQRVRLRQGALLAASCLAAGTAPGVVGPGHHAAQVQRPWGVPSRSGPLSHAHREGLRNAGPSFHLGGFRWQHWGGINLTFPEVREQRCAVEGPVLPRIEARRPHCRLHPAHPLQRSPTGIQPVALLEDGLDRPKLHLNVGAVRGVHKGQIGAAPAAVFRRGRRPTVLVPGQLRRHVQRRRPRHPRGGRRRSRRRRPGRQWMISGAALPQSPSERCSNLVLLDLVRGVVGGVRREARSLGPGGLLGGKRLLDGRLPHRLLPRGARSAILPPARHHPLLLRGAGTGGGAVGRRRGRRRSLLELLLGLQVWRKRLRSEHVLFGHRTLVEEPARGAPIFRAQEGLPKHMQTLEDLDGGRCVSHLAVHWRGAHKGEVKLLHFAHEFLHTICSNLDVLLHLQTWVLRILRVALA